MCSQQTRQVLQSFAIIVIVWNCKPGLHLFQFDWKFDFPIFQIGFSKFSNLILLLTGLIFTCVVCSVVKNLPANAECTGDAGSVSG